MRGRPKWAKVHAVILGALHQMHMFELRRDRFDGIDDVAQHRHVVLDALDARLAVLGASRVEDMRHSALFCEGAATSIPIEQVRREKSRPGPDRAVKSAAN